MAKDVGTLIEKARKELSKLTGLTASSTIGVVKDERDGIYLLRWWKAIYS